MPLPVIPESFFNQASSQFGIQNMLGMFFSVLMKLRESYHTAPFINEATIIDDKRSP